VKKAKEQDRRLKRIQERDMDEALEKEAMNRLIEEKRRQVIRRNELEVISYVIMRVIVRRMLCG